MSQPDKPTAEVSESPTGQLDIVVTIPASSGPVTLSMGVLRDQETGDWTVLLPLWPKAEDLRSRDGVNCPCFEKVFEKVFDDDPDDKYDPGDKGQYWEVVEGGVAYLVEPEVS
jgi:hypothetical protein